MQAIELTLLSYPVVGYDEIGQEKSKETKNVVPIIKNLSVGLDEFYAANQKGMKPTAKFIISSLNYNGESELEYMGTYYSIIRATSANPDEITLVAGRKVGNGY